MSASSTEILEFWYTPETQPTAELPFGRHRMEWFRSPPEFDKQIEDLFQQTYEAAARGDLDGWAATPMGALALVIILDQFPRNIFRGTADAFATDGAALRVAQATIAKGDDAVLTGVEKLFLYMPFQHSEDIGVQRRSLELYRDIGDEQCWESAQRHYEIIERFGRFPHRNQTLERTSTADEAAFLEGPNSSF